MKPNWKTVGTFEAWSPECYSDDYINILERAIQGWATRSVDAWLDRQPVPPRIALNVFPVSSLTTCRFSVDVDSSRTLGEPDYKTAMMFLKGLTTRGLLIRKVQI